MKIFKAQFKKLLVLKEALSGLIQFLAFESPLKMMKNIFFYFTLKARFVLMIFKFLFWLLVMQKNALMRKLKLILKFMTSQPISQTIAICILTNISRTKGNQIRKFGQLIEYNMRTIFLEKSYAKCDVIQKMWRRNYSQALF